MNQPVSQDNPTSWTWAEQISTYRFWGLLLFYLLSAMSTAMLTGFLPLVLENEREKAGLLIAVIAVSSLPGLYLAWAAVRWKTVPVLLFAAVLHVIGELLLTTPHATSITPLHWAGAALFGIGSGIIILVVPSVIAGGRGGAAAFTVAFGILLTVARLGEAYAPILMGRAWENSGPLVFRGVTNTFTIASLIFLLPVKHALFNSTPPKRGKSLPPTEQAPIVVALLALVPFYWLHWLYRSHGEIKSLTASRAILSPLASVLISLFAPIFIYPIIMTSLIDALNQSAADAGKPRYRRPWAIFLWSLFFPPAAMAFIQSSMNRVMGESTVQNQAAG